MADLPDRAVADTSVFIARENGRDVGELPSALAVSMVTAAELELGVLRAPDDVTRARRLSTLTQVRASLPLLAVDDLTASCFAQLMNEALATGSRPQQHDTWIAATAMRHGVPVATQDEDFQVFSSVHVIRV